MLDIAGSCGANVYIRNASFLGFPAYGIIARGMSIIGLEGISERSICDEVLDRALAKITNARTQDDYEGTVRILKGIQDQMKPIE